MSYKELNEIMYSWPGEDFKLNSEQSGSPYSNNLRKHHFLFIPQDKRWSVPVFLHGTFESKTAIGLNGMMSQFFRGGSRIFEKEE